MCTDAVLKRWYRGDGDWTSVAFNYWTTD